MRLNFLILVLITFTSLSSFAQTSCMNFDTLSGVYGPSSPNGNPGYYEVFHTEGSIELSAQGFENANGSIDAPATVVAGENLFSGSFILADGVFIKTSPSSTLIFDVPISDTVTFDFIDWNSTINFAVNNEQITVVDDFSDLPSAIAPGVTMSLNTQIIGAGIVGTVTLTGYIHKVKVGGDNLGLDDICQVTGASACFINELTVSAQACDNGNFLVDLDFMNVDTGSMGFNVTGNGTNYGTFYYAQLPLTLGPLSGDNLTDWSFTVADVEFPFCTDNENLGVIDCPVCYFDNILVASLGCESSSTYTAYVELIGHNTANSTEFDIYIDGNFLNTYLYSTLPILNGFPSSPAASQVMTICDGGSISCCTDYTLTPENCAPAACDINSITNTTTCDTTGLFDMTVDFQYSNTGTNFTITGNGINNTYSYAQLPVTITDLSGDGTTDYQFVITDDTDSGCTGSIPLGTVFCPLPCDLSNVIVDSLTCTTDSTYSLVLDLTYTGSVGSSFELTIDGSVIGYYTYIDLPVTIDGLSGNGTAVSLNACDTGSPNCCTSTTYTSLDCAPPPVCEISNMSALPGACDVNGYFDVTIDFYHNNTDTAFILTGNGTNYGTFNYAVLPITITDLIGDNTTSYEFFVEDVVNPNCAASVNIGVMDCPLPCDLSNVFVDSLTCTTDSTYSLVLDLTYTGSVGSSFELTIDGSVIGSYAYIDLPVTIDGLSGNGTIVSLNACDTGSPNCCTSTTFTSLDCAPPPVCEISNMNALPGACDVNGYFDVTIDFDHSNSDTAFILTGNGTNYGTFNYSTLPLTVTDLLGDNVTSYEFFVEDVANPNCSASVNIGVVNCPLPCDLSNVFVDSLTCTTDSTYSLVLDLTHTGSVGSSFELTIDGSVVGYYTYIDLPVTIDGLSGDGTVVSLNACDTGSPNCCTSTTYTSLDCASPPVCEISNMSALPGACDVNGYFDVTIDFYHNNTDTAFILTGNGTNYGTFNYAALPITITDLIGDNTTNYEFFVEDVVNPNCAASVNIGVVNCPLPCIIDLITVDSLICTSDSTYAMLVNIAYSGSVSSSFDLTIGNQMVGNFAYAALPVWIDDLMGDGNIQSGFACDSNPGTGCCADFSFTTLDCAPPPVCEITNFTATVGSCDNGFFNVEIDFDHSNAGSTFTLTGNGTTYGVYTYGSLPITISGLAGDNTTDYYFDVYDTNEQNCFAIANMGIIDCPIPCVFDLITVDSLICTSDSTYAMLVDIAYSGPVSSSFDLTIGNQMVGNFAYASLPVWVDDLEGDGNIQGGFACDSNPGTGCCADFSFTALDCAPPVCEIGTLSIIEGGCDSFGKYNATLDFDYNNTSSTFTVYANGINYGSFAYSELPVSIGAFIGDGTTYQVTVEDNGPVACTNGGVAGPIQCPVTCEISAVETQALQCTSDTTYSLYLDFNYSGNVSSDFKVKTSTGQLVGTYAYSQLPITINNYPSNGSTPETVSVCDAENNDCCATKSFTPLVCILPCVINSVTATPLACDSAGFFNVSLDLTVTDPGSGFSVSGNGTNYGTFSYTALPVTLGPFEGDGLSIYELVVEDIDNPDCANEVLFGEVLCTPTVCTISNLTATPQQCDTTSGLFMIELNMTAANTSPVFSVMVNGAMNGSYAYADLPVMVGPFFGDGVSSFNVLIQDVTSPNCVADIIVDPVSCTEACELSNLVVETLDCNSPDSYGVIIDVDYANTTGGFEVYSSNGYIGFYDYSALPITILDYPFIGDPLEVLTVCDAMNQNCCTEIVFETPDCTSLICELDSMSVELLPCDSLGNVHVFVNLDYTSPSDSFSLQGNGINYGTFSYADLPVMVGPFEGDEVTIYELEAIDIDNPNCTDFTVFGPIDCIFNCELSNLAAEPVLCTSDSTYSLQLQFEFEDVSPNGFDVFAQGMLIGNYSYAELPLEIEDFPIMGADVIQLSICDSDNPNCCASIIYDEPDCSNGCNIYEVIVTPFACELGIYDVMLDLEYQNPGSLGFQVFGSGNNYGNFSYNDLPITLSGFQGDGSTPYEFIVVDLVNADCVGFSELDPIDCTLGCTISNIEVVPSSCVDSMFMVTLSFDFENAGADGFTVNSNGSNHGTFSYMDLPVVLGPFVGDGTTIYELGITDMANDSCTTFTEIEVVDCTISGTSNILEEKTIIRYDFIGEEVVINFNHGLEEDAALQIFNAAGTRMLNGEIKMGQSEMRISMQQFASGWYVVRLNNGEGQVSHPFVKAR